MKGKLIKKVTISSGIIFLLLVTVLGVHIYIVTRPHPIDPRAVAMARIDIKQPIDKTDADKIVSYLDAQSGVSHVLVNPKTDIVVFSFFPARVSADQIVQNFKAAMDYKAERFVPTKSQLSGACPMGFSGGDNPSFISKVFNFFK
jgi:hypothetical protein